MIPRIPPHIPIPCRDPELSGNVQPNGEVIDLWFGDTGKPQAGPGERKEAYRRAATLCWKVCAIEHPEAFAECARAGASRENPSANYAVMGGIIPDDPTFRVDTDENTD